MAISFVTLGLFNIYYYYKNFSKKAHVGEFDLVIFIKSVLYPYFSYSFLIDAGNATKRSNSFVKFVFMLQLVFVVGGVAVIHPLNFLGFLTFIPLTIINNMLLAGDAELDDLEKIPNVLIYLGFAIVVAIVLSRLFGYF
jgi:hypothetical protein